MSVDVFGRQLDKSQRVRRGPPGIGFVLTKEANFDIQNKKLCNVASGSNPNDAANLNDLQNLKLELKTYKSTDLKNIQLELKKEIDEVRDICNNVLKALRTLPLAK